PPGRRCPRRDQRAVSRPAPPPQGSPSSAHSYLRTGGAYGLLSLLMPGGHSVSAAVVRRRGRRTAPGSGEGHRGGDARTGRGDQPPLGAEAVAALPVVHAGPGVTREVVQRVAVVGDLLGAVGPGDRAEVAGV